jgi:hypothetical protein
VAEHLQSTHHPIPVQVAVMKLVLFDNVAIQTVKVFFREQLASEETGTA